VAPALKLQTTAHICLSEDQMDSFSPVCNQQQCVLAAAECMWLVQMSGVTPGSLLLTASCANLSLRARFRIAL
jgi:hypothetical protein